VRSNCSATCPGVAERLDWRLGERLRERGILPLAIALDGTADPALLADCILDELSIAEQQQALVPAEGLARGPIYVS
jgi:hypothetical protein